MTPCLLVPLFHLIPVLAQGPIEPIELWDKDLKPPCLPFHPQNTIAWPANPSTYGTPAGFGRTVIGDLNGDFEKDAVVLADGVAVALWSVALQDALVPVTFDSQSPPIDVTDAAIVPGLSPDGWDVLVMSDERGLYQVSYDGFEFSDPVALAGTELAFAKILHADDVDKDNDVDVLAVAADKRSVYLCTNNGSSLSTSLLFVEQWNIHDLVAVHWDADSDRDIVTLTTRGLAGREFNGTLISGSLHLASTGCITRIVTNPESNTELVAWSRPTSGLSQLILKNATSTEGPWDLSFTYCGTTTIVHPSALIAGNYDLDADEDLLIAHQGGPTAFVLNNYGEAPRFDTTGTFSFDVLPLAGTAITGGVGIPAFTEVDGAGTEDLVFPVVDSEKVEVFLQYPYERAVFGQPVTSATVTSPRTEFGAVEPPALYTELRLAFRVPSEYQSYTHVEYKVWEQVADNADVTPVALEHVRRPLLRQGGLVVPERQWIEIVSGSGTYPGFPPFTGDGCWGDVPKPNYYVQFRFSRWQSFTWIKSPVFTAGFTAKDCSENPTFTYIDGLGIANASFPLYEDNELLPEGPELIDRNQLGLFVPMSAKPPFDENTTPSAGYLFDFENWFAHGVPTLPGEEE